MNDKGEPIFAPLDFWFNPNARLSLPQFFMPHPETGEMWWFDAAQGTGGPLTFEDEPGEIGQGCPASEI